MSDTFQIEVDDPQMIDAMKRARQTFSDFRSEVEADWKRLIPVIQSSMIKAYFANPEEPDKGEHLWMQYEGFTDELIHGTVLSTPDYVREVNQGDKVSLPLSHLSDWLYVKDNIAHGAYTAQLLRSRMTINEREQHDAAYPFKFKDE